MIVRLLLILSLCVTTCWAQEHSPAQAADARHKSVYLSVGNYTEYVGSVQTDDQGSTNTMDFAPTLTLGLNFALTQNWDFEPEFGLVLPRDQQEEKVLLNPFGNSAEIVKTIYMLRFDFVYPINHFAFRMGSSLFLTNISGEGGTMTLNNGSGTSDFYLPGENKTALSSSLDFGLDIHLPANPNWALRLQSYVFSPFNSEKTQVSYLFGLSYYWTDALSSVKEIF